jgi:hypothetical protein
MEDPGDGSPLTVSSGVNIIPCPVTSPELRARLPHQRPPTTQDPERPLANETARDEYINGRLSGRLQPQFSQWRCLAQTHTPDRI